MSTQAGAQIGISAQQAQEFAEAKWSLAERVTYFPGATL